jgi:hypothetical protein
MTDLGTLKSANADRFADALNRLGGRQHECSVHAQSARTVASYANLSAFRLDLTAERSPSL